MTIPQQTSHHRMDEASRFWHSDGDHSAPAVDRDEELNDDVKSAYREAQNRSSERDDLEASRDDLDTLRHGFGSIKNALEFGNHYTRRLREDPLGAREELKRHYLSRMPNLAAPKEAPATPPDHLDDRGRIEWQREQDVRAAVRSVAADKAFQAEVDEAAPLLADLKRDHGDLRKALETWAGVHAAAEINPDRAFDRVSYTVGAPINQAHANEMVRAAQYQQQHAEVTGWMDHVIQSGAFPGLEKPEVFGATAKYLEHMNANGLRTNSIEQDLGTAWHYATQGLQQKQQVEQEKADAERAKQASRSLEGGAHVNEVSADDTDDITETVRRAYRAQAA